MEIWAGERYAGRIVRFNPKSESAWPPKLAVQADIADWQRRAKVLNRNAIVAACLRVY